MRLFLFFSFFTLISIILLSSCSNDSNPVGNDDNSEHFEAIGLYLIESGDTIVAYIGGIVTGQIEVADSSETPLIYAKFLTDDGNVGTPQGDHHSLQLEIADTTIAVTETHAGEDWEFHVIGKQVGQTSIEISIFHNDHPDFVSKAIPIEVSP
jgi:hypothetical protein